ncbi:MAG: hypothetical protein DHS20C01_30600 [marine bacterium B5-7]|nr:MAG: hypothetical protein DHS20C01_30600 [marine bacterium B5-7]
MNLLFAWPWMFLLAPLPLAVIRWLPPVQRSGGAIRVPFFSTISALFTPDSRRSIQNRWIRLAILGLCWLTLISAAARPQWIGGIDYFPIDARSLMLAIDVSGSMKTEDLELDGKPVDRLSVVRRLATSFVARREGDRVGLILFGSQAYLQAPLTFDRKTVATFIDEALIGIAGERTAIGDAIGLAVKRLIGVPSEQRVLILMTDGANTAGAINPDEAARLAAQADLTIYTIGIGASSMVVESLFGSRQINPSRDLDEALLTRIAESTGGKYFRARSSEDLQQVYELLDTIEPIPQISPATRRIKELFYWPLGVVVFVMFGWMIAGCGFISFRRSLSRQV